MHTTSEDRGGTTEASVLGMLRNRGRTPALVIIDARALPGRALLAASSLRAYGYRGDMLGLVPSGPTGHPTERQLLAAGCDWCTGSSLCPSEVASLLHDPSGGPSTGLRLRERARVHGGAPGHCGFTLVELLVVIAVVAVLISLLAPAISGARLAGRRCVSAANLHSLYGVHAAYWNEHKDSLLNPFDAGTPTMYPGLQTLTGPVAWSTVIAPCTSQTASPGGLTIWDASRTTEAYCHIWGSYVADYLEGIDDGPAWMRDPSDPVLAQRTAELRASSWPQNLRLYDTSYWYPPVFWLKSERYQSETFVPIGPAPGESQWLARHTISSVPMSSHKALLFERMDWSGRRPVQWNNLRARPQVAFVDGSVSVVTMADVHALAESAHPNVTGTFRPSGYFDPAADFAQTWLIGPPVGPSDGTDPYETGGAPYAGTTAWRQYLYATRKGVGGMDVGKR
ncbi:MAG: prepilin-type N-terminal cleavage/methylation domain-containing protein [Phycisphaeraceae bacterium]|nr:prepilin-type N-terminal cleavage/methylation domain-containing protein [Phycisphaeraceae bacterium]